MADMSVSQGNPSVMNAELAPFAGTINATISVKMAEKVTWGYFQLLFITFVITDN